MTLYYATGVGAVLNFISSTPTTFLLPVQLRGVSPTFDRATQPILMSTGGANSLIGYTPSSGATSGFTIGFALPYNAQTAPTGTSGTTGTAAAMLAGLLDAAGITITLNLEDTTGTKHVGAISCGSCFVRTLTLTGSEGGIITGTAQCDSASVPLVGTEVAGGPGYALAGNTSDVFKFIDVSDLLLPVYDGTSGSGHWTTPSFPDVASFTFTIQRTLAAYRGNSVTGIAKHLKIVRTEAMLDAEYLKSSDDSGGAVGPDTTLRAAIGDLTVLTGTSIPGYIQTLKDAKVELSEVTTSGAPRTLTMTLSNAFQDRIPEQVGDTETYITERMHLKATAGGYSFSAP